jgi:hypothetical protein
MGLQQMVRRIERGCPDAHQHAVLGEYWAAEARIDDSFHFSRPLQNAIGRLWLIRSDSISHVPFTRTRFWR